MRVLLTTDTVGGVWTFTRELTQELLLHNHDIALISFGRLPSDSQRAWTDSLSRQHADRFQYVASDAPLEWMQENDEAYTSPLGDLLRLVEDFAPDIIHSNQFCFGTLPCHVPVIVTAHSDVMSWAQACEPETLRPSPWLERYQHLVQRGLERAAAIVAPTDWMLAALRRNFCLPTETRVIFNGRNLPMQSPKQQPFQAVSAGRLWDKAKNIAMLMQLRFSIIVAGDFPGQMAQTLDLPTSLQMTGPLCEEQLFELFTASTVYIVASLYEPFGLAALEAALCGCAVVAHDIPSLREVWGEHALYFEDPETLRDMLLKLQSDPAALQRIRVQSQARARFYTGTRMTQHYLELYRGILQSQGSPMLESAHA